METLLARPNVEGGESVQRDEHGADDGGNRCEEAEGQAEADGDLA
jgi:hypothetical protein